MHNAPLLFKDFDVLVSALLTAWETNGKTIGVGKHLQIRQLLQAMPAELPPEHLKTLLAPLLAENRQEQFEFYQLFDQVLQDQTAAQLRHTQMVEEEIRAAKRDFRRQWWLKLIQRLKNLKALISHLVQRFPRLRLAFAIGLFLFFTGLLIRWLLHESKPIPKIYEFVLFSDYESQSPRQQCYSNRYAGASVTMVREIVPARYHQVQLDWQAKEFCLIYLRTAIGVDSLLYEFQTVDGQTHLFRFILQFPKPAPRDWSPPKTDKNSWRVGPSGELQAGQLADPSFPKLSPVDSTKVLFDTAHLVQKPSQYATGVSSAWQIGFGYAYFNQWKWLLIGLVAAVLLFVGHWRQRRRQQFVLNHISGAKPPYAWTLRIPNTGNLQLGESFFRAATEMRRRQEGTFQRLDVKATVRATVEQGGMIQFRYQKQPLSKEFLFLLDRQSPQNHRSCMFEEICQQWKINEVPLELFYFNGDPRLCWNDRHPGGLTPYELYLKYPEHRLIVWGAGHELLNLKTGLLQPWSDQFDRWRRRLILTPRPTSDWDLREDTLAQRFRLLPATAWGIGELVETIEAIEAKSHLLVKIQDCQETELLYWLPRAKGTDLIRLLEAELIEYKHGVADDRLLQWLAACALPPVLFWDWTLYMGEKLSLPNEHFLHSDHLFKILRLPWFVEGKMPSEVQSSLLTWLDQKHPAFLETVRREWDQVLHLEANMPPIGSIAWEGHRISVVLNQLMLKPKRLHRTQLENELDQLLATGAHDQALVIDYLEQRKDFFSSILSSRFRKFVQTKQGLFWRWRDWVWQLPVFVCFFLATALVHYTEPVRTYRVGTYIKDLALSSDNKYLLIGSGDRRVSLWSLEGEWIRGFEGYHDEIIGVDFGLDNTSVLTGTADNFIAFWDIWGQVQRSRQGSPQLVSAIAFDPDKNFVVLGYYETGNGVLAIVDMEKNVLSARFVAHPDAITDIAVSPSGDAILTAGRDKLVKLWDMKGNLLQTFTGHTDIVHAVAFSPHGDRIFSASRDNTARMWNREGLELQIFRGHRNDVYDIACAPDNSSILTASADHTARIWSLDGQTLRVFDGHYEPVRIARFSMDGQRVVTASTDGTVKVWHK